MKVTMQNDFDAISSKIRIKIDKLTSLINKTDKTINHLYDENALIDDRDARISNKGAIDLHNDIVKTQRDTVELVIDISQACLQLHQKNKQDRQKYEEETALKLSKLDPIIGAQETTNRIRSFSVWLGGFSVIGAMGGLVFYFISTKHLIQIWAI